MGSHLSNHNEEDAQRPLLYHDDENEASGSPYSEQSGHAGYHSAHFSSSSGGAHRLLQTIRNNYHRTRYRTAAFLESSYQHYMVLALVALDLLSIFVDLFVTLYACEQEGNKPTPVLQSIQDVCAYAGLVFSCAFMVELLMNCWIFGLGYFDSWFHIVDSLVIIIAFVVDVILKGLLEEVASLVVVLRLWRFVKIIEEFSLGAEEQMEGLERRVEELELENADLKRRLGGASGSRKRLDEEEGTGSAGHA